MAAINLNLAERDSVDEVTLLSARPGEPHLLVRHQRGAGAPVLYVHGATFPSALSISYRFDGYSWADDLVRNGLDVWAFDFAGYGGSDRPGAFMAAPDAHEPIGCAAEVTRQLARVIDHVLQATGSSQVSLIAHSWGTMVAGRVAAESPAQIRRIVFFAPIVARDQVPTAVSRDAWRLITIRAQLERFVEDVPSGHAPVLIEPSLARWGPAYLDTDPAAYLRNPNAVKVPGGPMADIARAWSGQLAYDPAQVSMPLLVVRGQWDRSSTAADARWLLERLPSTDKVDLEIAAATHLMHLERGRAGLFAASAQFLAAA